MMTARRPLRLFALWLLLGWGLVLLIVQQSLTATPVDAGSLMLSDKAVHFGAYFALMGWFAQIYRRQRHGVLAVLFVGMGVAIEFLQGQTAYRMFEYYDILANSSGVLLAWWLALTPFSHLLLRLESRLLPA